MYLVTKFEKKEVKKCSLTNTKHLVKLYVCKYVSAINMFVYIAIHGLFDFFCLHKFLFSNLINVIWKTNPPAEKPIVRNCWFPPCFNQEELLIPHYSIYNIVKFDSKCFQCGQRHHPSALFMQQTVKIMPWMTRNASRIAHCFRLKNWVISKKESLKLTVLSGSIYL